MNTTTDCSPLHLVSRDFNYVIVDRSCVLYACYYFGLPAPIADADLEQEQRSSFQVSQKCHQLRITFRNREEPELMFRCQDFKSRTDVDNFIQRAFGLQPPSKTDVLNSVDMEGRAGSLSVRPPTVLKRQ
jgi:hypothetical protein